MYLLIGGEVAIFLDVGVDSVESTFIRIYPQQLESRMLLGKGIKVLQDVQISSTKKEKKIPSAIKMICLLILIF